MFLNTEIRAVTFDAGGTLIKPWPSVGAIYAEVAAEHGIRGLSADELTGRFDAAWRKRPDFAFTKFEWAGLVDETFAGLTPKPPSATFFQSLYERFDEASAWRIYEDAIPALETFASRGMRLAVISNWDERLVPLLRTLGLLRWFEAAVVSVNAGARKPDHRIFAQAAEALELRPDCILHVGDDETADAAGARAAGFHAVHLARHGRSSDPHPVADLSDVTRRLCRVGMAKGLTAQQKPQRFAA